MRMANLSQPAHRWSTWFNQLSTIWHPERFHGQFRQRPFFEGWYYKVVSANGRHKLAVIPGVALGKEPGEDHAFIQVLDGVTGRSYYQRFELDAFHYLSKQFDVKLGQNHFTKRGIKLAPNEQVPFQGELIFDQLQPWPVTFFSPGIMGPYSFIPTMECNHGVLSLDHGMTGQLKHKGVIWDFTDGRGYIEKDWGRSFPQAWIWMQSNHFGRSRVSLTASTALIPWRNTTFTGYIAGLWVKDNLYQFTTYNHSHLDLREINDQTMHLIFDNKNHILKLKISRADGGTLAAPALGLMTERIQETMNSTIEIQLSHRRSGAMIIQDQGKHACLEVVGDMEMLRQRLSSTH